MASGMRAMGQVSARLVHHLGQLDPVIIGRASRAISFGPHGRSGSVLGSRRPETSAISTSDRRRPSPAPG